MCLVSCWSDSSASEAKDISQWASWGNCCRLLGFYSWVSDCWGSWAGWKCEQGLEGQEDHTQAFAVSHQRWWRTWYTHQGNHCRRWSDPSHPQISDQQNNQRLTSSRMQLNNYVFYVTILFRMTYVCLVFVGACLVNLGKYIWYSDICDCVLYNWYLYLE